MSDEIEQIRARYERRKTIDYTVKYPAFSAYQHYMRSEREYWYGRFLTDHFGSVENRNLLEIGAGGGDNLLYMYRLGFSSDNIWANELQPERMETLKQRKFLPLNQLITGDASEMTLSTRFDVVFQSTVFSSILEAEFQNRMARKIWDWIKPGGIMLWYDFVYDNPWNSDVRGVNRRRVQELFPERAHERFARVTLAPPIGRRLGRLYPFFNWPILRTHIVAAFVKKT